MKRFLLLVVLSIVFSQSIWAQKLSETTISTDLKILVLDFKTVNPKIEAFIGVNNLVPSNYKKSKNSIDFSLLLDYSQFLELDKLVETWGYVYEKKTSSVNYTDDIKDIETEILTLEKEKKQYKALVENEEMNKHEKSFDYWEKVISIEREIERQKLAKRDLLKRHKKYSYDLYLIEDDNSTLDYSSSWINMPGVEYSLLFTEQPKEGLTSSQMQGINLKYMFNYGKTYALLGLYKNMDSNITTEIDETYIFALGQDFYSKRMGRGQRKFFNLYTSFNLGVYISTSETQKETSWFTNPFIGLEIFKNKYFLLDHKVGYFLPYQNNRNQRGLLYNASFNFVF